MKKAFVLIVMVLIVVLTLCMCSRPDTIPKKSTNKESMFCVVEEYLDAKIIVDRQTRVMYWLSDGMYNVGNLTMLVNADGTPKVWKGALDEN